MAYAEFPHIEATFTPVGTGTPYKVDWVNNVAGVMIAAGWEPEITQETNADSGEAYNRTIAPVVLTITQNGEFDSFGFFSSPPSASCDGLGVWGILPSGGGLSLGIDISLGPYDEVTNCCICNGNCSPGSKWGTGAGGTGTDSCGLDCADGGGGLCIVTETWTWGSGDISGQHNALITQIVKHTSGCGSAPKKSAVISQTITGSSAETILAIWCEGGTTNPLVGPTELSVPTIGAAFNSNVVQRHGGWVLHSQPSNTSQNTITVYLAVNRFQVGPADVIASTYPSMYSFSTYTSQTHPILYIEGTSTLAGMENRTQFRNDLNSMRMVANPYQAFMYSYGTETTGVTTGSENNLGVGAIRQVPLNGEDPTAPNTWDFTRAIFHFGEDGGNHLHEMNKIAPDGNSFYLTVNDADQKKLTTSVAAAAELGVAGFIWTLNNSVEPLEWISGEAFYSEPWTGFNSAANTAAPILGQLWDCIMPSKIGGSGYFFWDGEWWSHWQIFRTETTTGGGPMGNLAFRVGFQTLEGAEPINGTWAGLPEPRDVFLYNLQQSNVLEPFPWGNVTALSISNSTFDGGTTTRTLTATCTQHPDAPDDGDKLVAIHSNRNYFTFTPEIITIGDGDTTGTSIVTAVSPGLGGTTAMIFADSITQVSVSVTVDD